MLTARPAQSIARPLAASTDIASAHDALWIDLFHPTADEAALTAKLTGLRIPDRKDLEEIESSSRLFREDGSLYMSTPLVRRRDGVSSIVPLGLVVSGNFLLTIRYADYPAIETYGHTVATASAPLGVSDLLIGLLEAIVDRIADVLEIIGSELDDLSAKIFRSGAHEQSKRADERLRGLLKGIGRQGDGLSLIRDSLLGLRRLVQFAESAAELSVGSDLHARLSIIARDLQSLTEYDSQVTEKVQFLLNATLGLINIEQNNGIRLLTVVSLIGIPPTLIASIYGMNFKDIPELSWSFGYWYALGLMLASVVLPLAWLRRVGWI